MHVNFDTNDLTEVEARGIIALFREIYGDISAAYAQATTVPGARVVIGTVGNVPVTASTDEPDAAAAFTGQPEHQPVPDAAAAFGVAPGPQIEGTVVDAGRDVHGIPWDSRIHSDRSGSTGGKNQDGNWKRRRNTPDATFDAVMAELKGANTARTMEAAGALIPPPPSVPAPPTASLAPSSPPAAPAASSTVPAGSRTFPEIMRKVTAAQAAGKATPEAIANLLASIGANPPTVAAMAKDASLIPAFEALLDDHVAMQG